MPRPAGFSNLEGVDLRSERNIFILGFGLYCGLSGGEPLAVRLGRPHKLRTAAWHPAGPITLCRGLCGAEARPLLLLAREWGHSGGPQ